MNTRKLFILPGMLLLASLLLPSLYIHPKQSPGFMSPTQVASMQKERELAPIDKIELAKSQEKFKSKPIKYTRKGKPKKQRQPKKTLRYMTYEETKAGKDKLLAAGNYSIALKYQERMLKLCDNLNELELLFLEYADTHYNCAHYDLAAKLYTEFVQNYPGSSHTEYALYEAIECTYKLLLDAERDQANTHKTIELADQFLARSDIFTTYIDTVMQMKEACYQRLVQSEYNIYTFYLKDGRYKQAERRLTGIRDMWISKVPQIESELLMKEYDLAKRQNKLDLAQEKQQELALKFPEASKELTITQAPTKFLTKF